MIGKKLSNGWKIPPGFSNDWKNAFPGAFPSATLRGMDTPHSPAEQTPAANAARMDEAHGGGKRG
jgi:hypothetical protein